jgi:hypothetical protein
LASPAHAAIEQHFGLNVEQASELFGIGRLQKQAPLVDQERPERRSLLIAAQLRHHARIVERLVGEAKDLDAPLVRDGVAYT